MQRPLILSLTYFFPGHPAIAQCWGVPNTIWWQIVLLPGSIAWRKEICQKILVTIENILQGVPPTSFNCIVNIIKQFGIFRAQTFKKHKERSSEFAKNTLCKSLKNLKICERFTFSPRHKIKIYPRHLWDISNNDKIKMKNIANVLQNLLLSLKCKKSDNVFCC